MVSQFTVVFLLRPRLGGRTEKVTFRVTLNSLLALGLTQQELLSCVLLGSLGIGCYLSVLEMLTEALLSLR